MVDISVESIKTLRERTGAGIMDCKRALEETSGDLERAGEIIRLKGIASAVKKAERDTGQGVVDCYIHQGNRVGAMVEVNCETDFVARTQEFKDMVHDLAMQVAAMAPLYVDSEEIPEGYDVNAEEICLLEQSFIKDPGRTIKDLISEVVGRTGENIRIRRFERFALGE